MDPNATTDGDDAATCTCGSDAPCAVHAGEAAPDAPTADAPVADAPVAPEM